MFNKINKNIIVFTFYIIVGCIYFYDAIINGLLIASGDAWSYFYPLKAFYSGFLKEGFSFWLPNEYLGMPFLGNMQTGILYPLNFIYFFMDTPYAFNISLIFHYVLAAFFTYLYVKLINNKMFPAILAGVVFGFSGIMMAHKVYPAMVEASVWLPLLLYMYEKIRVTQKWKYSIWASLVIAVQILAGHFQICIYTYMVLAFFTVFYLWGIEKLKRIQFLILTVIPIILGAFIALPQLLATYELSSYAWRVKEGYEFFTMASMHPFMLILLVFPFVFGNGFGDSAYWGNTSFSPWTLVEYAGFIGILPIALAVFVFFKLRHRNLHIKFWCILCVVAIFLALGGYNPLYKALFYIPVYNLFRVSARHLLEFNLAVAVLFSFGINYLLNDNKKKLVRYIAWGITVVGIVGATVPWAVKYILESRYLLNLISKEGQNLLKVLDKASNLENILVFQIPLWFIMIYLIWLFVFYRLNGYRKILLSFLTIIVLLEAFQFGTFFNKDWSKITDVDKEINNSIMKFLSEKAGVERNVIVSDRLVPLYYVPAKVNALNGFEPLVINDFRKLLESGYDDFYDWETLLRKNLLLSTLNIHYIALSTESYIISKEMEKAVAAVKPKPIRYKDITLNKWNYSEAKVNLDQFTLKSFDSKKPSLIKQRLNLKSNTIYMISFEACALKKASGSLELVIDRGKDRNRVQRLDIESSNLKENFQTYTKIINTGYLAKEQIDIGLYTYSIQPISVRNIKVKELIDYFPPFLGKLEGSMQEKKEQPIYKEVFQDDSITIFENKNCLPKVFSIENIKIVKDLNEIKRNFDFFEFNPLKTALLYEEEAKKIGRSIFSKGDVSLVKYESNRILIDTKFEDEGFIVLAEQYYPGWKALIDGKETQIYKVNGILRGISIPKGSHKVVFQYKPINLYIGFIIGGLTLLICIVILFTDKISKKSKASFEDKGISSND